MLGQKVKDKNKSNRESIYFDKFGNCEQQQNKGKTQMFSASLYGHTKQSKDTGNLPCCYSNSYIL